MSRGHNQVDTFNNLQMISPPRPLTMRYGLPLDHPPTDLWQKCHKLKTAYWECSKFPIGLYIRRVVLLESEDPVIQGIDELQLARACRVGSFTETAEGGKLGIGMMPNYHACLNLPSSRRWHWYLTSLGTKTLAPAPPYYSQVL